MLCVNKLHELNKLIVMTTTMSNIICSPHTYRTVTQDISLTDEGQDAAATYETVPATYEEIPASKEVKGDYSYTQNNAYSTMSGREAPAAGGIYDN